jgi:ArsR family transcriptional regulator, arsenate/arsenite/antimonite-responsive transcriptional repressor
MDIDEERLLALEQDIVSLKERVIALEAAKNLSPLPQSSSIPSVDFGTLHLMQSRRGFPYEQDEKSGAVIYAGAAQIAERKYAWQVERPVPWLLQLLSNEPEILSQTFAALGSPLRLTLLQELLSGPKTSQQLQEALGVSSAGQLYHHLKELLAVSLIEQKSRNLYALPVRNVIPFLVLLATTRDTTGKE